MMKLEVTAGDIYCQIARIKDLSQASRLVLEAADSQLNFQQEITVDYQTYQQQFSSNEVHLPQTVIRKLIVEEVDADGTVHFQFLDQEENLSGGKKTVRQKEFVSRYILFQKADWLG